MKVWISEFPWWRLSLKLHPAEICGMAGIVPVVLRITHSTPHLAVYFSMFLCLSYICVWNIAMWQRKNRHSCSHVEDPHRIYKSDHMKQYPKKVLWISAVKIEKMSSATANTSKFHDQTQGIGAVPYLLNLRPAQASSVMVSTRFNCNVGCLSLTKVGPCNFVGFCGPPATISHCFFLSRHMRVTDPRGCPFKFFEQTSPKMSRELLTHWALGDAALHQRP